MKNCKIISLFITLAVIISCINVQVFSVTENTVLDETFSGGKPNWSIDDDSVCTIEDDGGNSVCQLSPASSKSVSAVFLDDSLINYKLTGRMKPMGEGSYGFIVRAVDTQNFLFVRLKSGGDAIESCDLYRVKDGLSYEIATVGFEGTLNTWFDFVIELNDDKISVSIDNKKLFDHTEIGTDYKTGGAGIRSYSTTARFDDIKVTEYAQSDNSTVIYNTLSEEYSELTGTWNKSSKLDYDGSENIKSTAASNSSVRYETYAPDLAQGQEANYLVCAWIPEDVKNDAFVSYNVTTLNGEWAKGIKQSTGSGKWNKIAVVRATGDTAIKVDIKTIDGNEAYVGAVKFVKTTIEADETGTSSGDIDLTTVMVAINQVGYDIGGIKRATVTNTDDGEEFKVIKSSDNTVVYTGKIKNGIADFTEFNPIERGEYKILCNGSYSTEFTIAKNWYQRVSVPAEMDFMEQSRNDAWLPGAKSIAWRDSHQFSFELPTLVMQYMSNPSLYENMERDIYKIDETYFENLRVQKEPDIIWLMKFAMEWYYNDNTNKTDILPGQSSAGHNLHPLIKEQAAYFLYIYPYIKEYVSEDDYIKYREWLIDIWDNSETDNTLKYYAVEGEKYNLFEVQTAVGTIKGSYPPGHSIVPNLMMYEVLKRDGIEGYDRYFRAAYDNCDYILKNIDITAPEYSKGQRMSEHVLMENLSYFLEMYPDEAPSGLKDAINKWADKMIVRSQNIWDIRMASSIDAGDSSNFWTGSAYAVYIGQTTSIMNEPGNEIGMQSIAYAAARVVDDEEKAQRLKEIGDAARDNMFGRNPYGRMFFYEATDPVKGIEGADLGWFAKHNVEGNGKLGEVRARIDGSPKEGAYPFNPDASYGYVEGWVAFNTNWNAALAYHAGDDLQLTVDKNEILGKESVKIRLKAPVNVDYEKEEAAFVYLKNKETNEISKVKLTEESKDDYYFSADVVLPNITADYTVSYGIGNFEVSEDISVTESKTFEVSDFTVSDGKVTGEITNVTNSDKDVLVILAQYDESGKLLGTKVDSVKIGAQSSNDKYSINHTFTYNGKYKVKLFLWENNNTNKPYEFVSEVDKTQ